MKSRGEQVSHFGRVIVSEVARRFDELMTL
jgi:hypothetical protein